MNPRACSLFILSALPLLAAAPAFGQACEPFWAAAGSSPYYPGSMVVYDDGSGNALYLMPPNSGAPALKWSGQSWIDISATLPNNGYRIAGLNLLDDGNGPGLYALGSNQINGVFTYFSRRWSGSAWVPVPLVPADGSAVPLMSGDLGDGVQIYGWLHVPGPGNPYRIAKWTGQEWAALSPEFFPLSLHLIVFDDGGGSRLYAVGQFTSIGGVEVRGFARWLGGTAWERPPSNHTTLTTIYDVADFNDGSGPGLWAYGGVRVDGVELPGVAKWNGQIWTGYAGPNLPPQTAYARRRIEVFDDGFGPQLYVTGQFNNWGGIAARGIVRWNGQQWSAVGAGIYPGSEVRDMVVGRGPFGDTLFVGGAISEAGGGLVRYVAQYVACPNCYANCDLSTSPSTLNVNDFVCFMQKFIARDPYANCDNSTAAPGINVSDFICFAGKFAAGCP